MKLAQFGIVAALLLTSCTAAELLQNAKTVADIARNLCLVTGQEKTGLSASDVAAKFCETEEQLRPWIGVVKEAQSTGAMQTGMVKEPH